MENTNLKELFTDEDFKILNKAVDALPKLGFASTMMSEMLISAISNKSDDPAERERQRNERLESSREQEKEMEDTCLELKFKLLQLKKALQNV